MERKPSGFYRYIIANALLVFPLTYFFLNLIGSYWAYWDMGVNPGANSLVLLFLYAPVMLTVFMAVAVLVPLVAATVKVKGKMLLVVSILSLILTFAAAFYVEASGTADNRFDNESTTDFLIHYVQRLASGRLEPVRRRP